MTAEPCQKELAFPGLLEAPCLLLATFSLSLVSPCVIRTLHRISLITKPTPAPARVLVQHVSLVTNTTTLCTLSVLAAAFRGSVLASGDRDCCSHRQGCRWCGGGPLSPPPPCATVAVWGLPQVLGGPLLLVSSPRPLMRVVCSAGGTVHCGPGCVLTHHRWHSPAPVVPYVPSLLSPLFTHSAVLEDCY